MIKVKTSHLLNPQHLNSFLKNLVGYNSKSRGGGRTKIKMTDKERIT
jgi:hypothetical protein